MTENWDKFEPFKVVKKQGFSFQPSRYETWIDGKIANSGIVRANVIARVLSQNSSEKMCISFNEMNLENEILSELYFDEFVTQRDRLQLITIPNETNSENMAIVLLKMTIGATCQQKDFSSKEPYCCNIFLKNGVTSKITFSFSSPEKLIELYQ